MTQPDYTLRAMANRGEKIYRERIHPTLTESDIGKFVHIDLNSGDYEIDTDDISGELKLRARKPGSRYYGLRVGYTAAEFFDGCNEAPNWRQSE